MYGNLPLSPEVLLGAYAGGCFPMGLGEHGKPPIGWWSPDPRGIVTRCAPHASRSLRRRFGEFTITVNTDFRSVVAGCADPRRDGRWITADVYRAYAHLQSLGYAHSVEVWGAEGLVGGLYGVQIGGIFAGESMFHRATDASKIAMVAAGVIARTSGAMSPVFDVQWRTPHLGRMGVEEVPRETYLAMISAVRNTKPGQWGLFEGRRWRLKAAPGAADESVTLTPTR